ncbi:MAG TPA: glycosyltransferase family 2 protein [Candidatus Saccharimonadales bacterium]|nr:glycosyltransferase family 2 protein [Candidatus Saccharimonadales bacterium]
MNKNVRVSIVVPVYNEEEQLAACLAAMAAQTVQPYEVIVVDNNSSDQTATIAEQYPFVTLLHEHRQGVVYARDKGFNSVRGDIIGRIDADTVLSPTWIATIIEAFQDDTLAAVTGRVHYKDIAAARLVDRIDLFWRRRMARLLGREVALQGANMAIRRDVWLAIRKTVCHTAGLHEDFDLAIHANQCGYVVRYDERLEVDVLYRQAAYNFRDFARYSLTSPRTYAAHGLKSGRHMYEVVAFVLALYPAINMLHRGYDIRKGAFRLRTLLNPQLTTAPRVNPATFVE